MALATLLVLSAVIGHQKCVCGAVIGRARAFHTTGTSSLLKVGFPDFHLFFRTGPGKSLNLKRKNPGLESP